MSWWYAEGDQRRGPFAEPEFRVLIENGTIRPSTLIWREGMPQWTHYGQLVAPGIPTASGEPMRFAGFWIRFVAKFLDGLILSVPIMIIYVPFMIMQMPDLMENNDPNAMMQFQLTSNLISLITFPFQALYFILFVGAKGATPAKMLLGLRVVRADGSPVGYGLATGRWFAAALNYMTLYIGWIMAGIDKQKRGLHDMICDTRVIHTR